MTLSQAPANLSSVNSDLLWMVYDANAVDSTKIDYKYVGELHINGTLVHIERVFPRPDSGRGVFNFGTVIRSYVDPLFNPAENNILALQMGVNVFKAAVVVKVREEYNGTVGAIVFTDAERVFFNHYNTFGPAINWISGFLNKTATERSKKVQIPFGTKRYYVPYFHNSLSATFTASSTAQDNTTINNTISVSENNNLFVMNISPVAINANGTTPNSILATDDRYSVSIAGDVYEVELVCPGKYKNYVVHFLGQSGGWESMLFNKVSNRSKNIERKNYMQPAYRLASNSYSYLSGSSLHEQNTVYSSVWNERLRLRTDWLDDKDHTWLATLLQSPIVLLDDNTNIYPVTIRNTDYEVRQWLSDGLQQLTIDVEFTGKYNAQYR